MASALTKACGYPRVAALVVNEVITGSSQRISMCYGSGTFARYRVNLVLRADMTEAGVKASFVITELSRRKVICRRLPETKSWCPCQPCQCVELYISISHYALVFA
jgi:hypothetical protein